MGDLLTLHFLSHVLEKFMKKLLAKELYIWCQGGPKVRRQTCSTWVIELLPQQTYSQVNRRESRSAHVLSSSLPTDVYNIYRARSTSYTSVWSCGTAYRQKLAGPKDERREWRAEERKRGMHRKEEDEEAYHPAAGKKEEFVVSQTSTSRLSVYVWMYTEKRPAVTGCTGLRTREGCPQPSPSEVDTSRRRQL